MTNDLGKICASAMTVEEFEKIVFEALKDLPSEFKERIDNVDVVVEDWPSLEIARGRLLLGLYQGVPKTTWGRGQGLKIPDKITVFRGPIEFLSRGDAETVKKLIVDTVKHEIAHHFGISDARLSQLRK